MSLAGLYIGTSILISDLVFHLGFSHSKSLNPSILISMNESKKKLLVNISFINGVFAHN